MGLFLDLYGPAPKHQVPMMPEQKVLVYDRANNKAVEKFVEPVSKTWAITKGFNRRIKTAFHLTTAKVVKTIINSHCSSAINEKIFTKSSSQH